jgi:hypothetical protein
LKHKHNSFFGQLLKREEKIMEDLIRRIKECNPCPEGIEWVEEQKSKEDILNNCPHEWKIWAIKNGILDFLDYLNYEELNGFDISRLLIKQPQLIYKFELDKLDRHDIVFILKYKPQFIKRLNLKDLNGFNIADLLSSQPQLIDKFDLGKLKGGDISYLLCHQPQFIDKFDLEKLKGEDIAWLLNFQCHLKKYFDKKRR